MLLLPFLATLVANALAFNVMVYCPSFGDSHTNFLARLADTLTEAGHNVTFLVPLSAAGRIDKLGVGITKDVVVVEPDEEMSSHVVPMDADVSFMWTVNVDSSNGDQVFAPLHKSMVQLCENLMRNKKVFEQMKMRNFDVAIFEPLTVCGMGYAKALGIDKMITATSCGFLDGVVDTIGEPIDASSVPSVLSKAGRKMTLLERLENHRLVTSMIEMEGAMHDDETKVYRHYLGKDLPDWRQLLISASLYFTNTIPYLDFPRLVTPKTVPIGGISLDIEKIRSQKLPAEWESILNARPHSMLISFGSAAKSTDMPEKLKSGLLEVIRSEPDITFIWKYESDDHSFAKGIDNIHFSKWVPQTALLNDNRLTAFLTHGGLGSTNELAHFGKPALMIPLYGDQYRNANMLASHGGVAVLFKNELANVKVLRETIRSVIFDKSYKQNAARLAEMLQNQPTTPKEQVKRMTEFVAKYGPFPQMDMDRRQMGIVQRNLLDVYFMIAAPYLVCILIFIIVAHLIFALLRRNKNEKQD